MVKVRGTSYTTRSCCPPCHSTTCSSNRVIRTGPSYVSRSLFSSLFQPTYPSFYRPINTSCYRTPTTVILNSSTENTTNIHPDKDIMILAVLAVFAIGIAIAVGISISRDCHLVETECTELNFWGDRICTPIYDCKW